MSRKVGGRDPPPYKYASRKALDHHTDRLGDKIDRLREDVKQVRNQVRHVIRFLKEGPHANAYDMFVSSLEDEKF